MPFKVLRHGVPCGRAQLERVDVVGRPPPVATGEDDKERVDPLDRVAYERVGLRAGCVALRVHQLPVHREEVEPVQVVEGAVAAAAANLVRPYMRAQDAVTFALVQMDELGPEALLHGAGRSLGAAASYPHDLRYSSRFTEL